MLECLSKFAHYVLSKKKDQFCCMKIFLKKSKIIKIKMQETWDFSDICIYNFFL